MADNIKIKMDASKWMGAFRHTIQGKSSAKECLCIPIENFFQGKNGALYIDFIGFDAQGKYGKLYSLKQSVTSDKYKTMSEQERKAMPYCGDVVPFGRQAQAGVTAQMPVPETYGDTGPDADLPF